MELLSKLLQSQTELDTYDHFAVDVALTIETHVFNYPQAVYDTMLSRKRVIAALKDVKHPNAIKIFNSLNSMTDEFYYKLVFASLLSVKHRLLQNVA